MLTSSINSCKADAKKKGTPTDQSSSQGQWGPPLKGHQGEAMKSIIEDLAHAGNSTTVRKKGSGREASTKLLIKNQRFSRGCARL
jgi:hypothetical protein